MTHAQSRSFARFHFLSGGGPRWIRFALNWEVEMKAHLWCLEFVPVEEIVLASLFMSLIENFVFGCCTAYVLRIHFLFFIFENLAPLSFSFVWVRATKKSVGEVVLTRNFLDFIFASCSVPRCPKKSEAAGKLGLPGTLFSHWCHIYLGPVECDGNSTL